MCIFLEFAVSYDFFYLDELAAVYVNKIAQIITIKTIIYSEERNLCKYSHTKAGFSVNGA
jgi:hypothetical protein